MKKKILVVGGTGFIGRHFLKKSVNKYDVYSLSINKIKKSKKINNVKYFRGDISSMKSLKKVLKSNKFDYVVNLGGYINHIDKQLANKTHLNGCKNLINFFKNKKIKLFIQIGSSTEYGKQKSPNIETLGGKPSTIYAKAKLDASKFLFNFTRKNYFPFTILRLYQVYGPEQKKNRLIPIVIDSCLKKSEFKCSSGLQVKDFLYVDDAVDAILKCFKNKKIINNVINIGSGQKISIKNLILKIVKKIGYGKPIFGVLKRRLDEPLKSYPSINKAKKVLLWSPKIKLDEGLKKTINYYKKINEH
tara:strand:+ start:1196 stop:2104 length:909 start_codon:yes stop_codon:yes gene_type:complete